MSNAFSFPPPPPPPSRRDGPTTTDVRGGFRGRGSSRGGSRGNFSRGVHQGYRGRGSHTSSQPHRNQFTVSQPSPINPGKRDHSTAFNTPSPTRPKAPPSVPSFNIDIKSLLPPKPTVAPDPPIKRKSNLLGLTPSNEEVSASEDDADDESKLATQTLTDGYKFEHKGQQLSLRTPAEIASWIAERKKRFPTRAKAEIARKEAEERQKQWEERKRVRDEEIRAKKEVRQNERNEKERHKLKQKLIAVQLAKAKSAVAENKQDLALQVRQKAEKLKKKAEKAARELELMEEQLLRLDGGEPVVGDTDTTNLIQGAEKGDDAGMSSDSDTDETSSSGSSASEVNSGSEPEEVTSKRVAPDRVAPSKQALNRIGTEGASLCKSMVKFGRCKFGRKCRFSHNVQREKATKPSAKTGRRMGLYQVMVEKEKEEELQQALKVIIALGEQGVLNEPQKSVMSALSESVTENTLPLNDARDRADEPESSSIRLHDDHLA